MWWLESLSYKHIAETILNFLLFIPIGFIASAGVRKKNAITVLGIGFGLSLAIKITQYIPKRGVCNIDDVILNTAGCAVGYGLFRLFCRLTKVTHKNTG